MRFEQPNMSYARFAFSFDLGIYINTDGYRENPGVFMRGQDNSLPVGRVEEFESDGQDHSGKLTVVDQETAKAIAQGDLVLTPVLHVDELGACTLLCFALEPRPEDKPVVPAEDRVTVINATLHPRPHSVETMRAVGETSLEMFRNTATSVRFNLSLAGGAIALSAANATSFPRESIQWAILAWALLVASMLAGITYIRALPQLRNKILQNFRQHRDTEEGKLETFRDAVHHWSLFFGLVVLVIAGIVALVSRHAQ
jgi:hypothetical protein